jgi:hypothetical protein
VSTATRNIQVIGRAKTALVFGRGDNQRAVMSAIVVRKTPAGSKRLCQAGSVKFADSTMYHIQDTILPITDRILRELGLPQANFEISAANLGVASTLDVGINISGFSADAAIFVAMLSAGLRMPLIDDFAATGHIASLDGDITAVKAIPAKLEAVETDKTIRCFIYPDLEEDGSLKALSPKERGRSIAAIMAARESIHTKAIMGVGELVMEVFAEEDVILASLREGFFEISGTRSKSDNPVSDAISFLANNSQRRFWDVLGQHFLKGECGKGKELLEAFVLFFVARQKYPKDLGGKLYQLVCSLPPAVRRLKMDFPILDTGVCIELSQFATKSEHGDVLRLFEASHAKYAGQVIRRCADEEPPIAEGGDFDCMAFDTVTARINEQALAQDFGIPIDSARGAYALDSSVINSHDEFIGTLEAFYIHLLRYASSETGLSIDVASARSEAIALLERAFHGKGGVEAAFARARDGTQGGMRSILDVFTEQYKAERQVAYIRLVFKDTIDSMDWDARVRFMSGAMKRLGPFLPCELRNEHPERFIRNYEAIVRAYVESVDSVGRLLRTL